MRAFESKLGKIYKGFNPKRHQMTRTTIIHSDNQAVKWSEPSYHQEIKLRIVLTIAQLSKGIIHQ